MPPRPPRRGLFWQVYPTLLASVVLVALLGALVWHLFGVVPMRAGVGVRMHGFFMHDARSLGLLLTVATVIGLGAYPVIARITRRLEALRRSVDAWGAGDSGRRADVSGDDEIAAVAASFNAAADRADQALAAQRTLLAHASHELRSPLARLALAVEMAVGGGAAGPTTPAGREIAELDALVGEILLSSRLDHGPDLSERERVDCLALAAEEAARLSIPMRDVPPDAGPFEVMGSARLLRRLIRNLLENAVKHGGPPVEIALTHAGAAGAPLIRIAVSDHGPGIPAAIAVRVFEPFFRPQGVGEDAGSWGLGLSLVRQIATRHGGRATCTATEGGGTTFVVELPASGAGTG